MSKKLQVLADPIVVNFFWNVLEFVLVLFFGNEKMFVSKKITSMVSKQQLNPTLVFFFKWISFSFQKNLQRLDQPTLVFFFKWFFFSFQKNLQQLDQPTLVFFLCIFEKKYNHWIKSFSKSKWTVLKPPGLC